MHNSTLLTLQHGTRSITHFVIRRPQSTKVRYRPGSNVVLCGRSVTKYNFDYFYFSALNL